MYGFSKIKNPQGFHQFKHPDFIRGQLSRLSNVKRKLNESHSGRGEHSGELKTLQFEYNRMKKAAEDFEESLKVLVKQNKKLMEANRQLVYQFYYFKKESDLKTKKVVFLFYTMLMNAYPDIQANFKKSFSNLINFSPELPPGPNRPNSFNYRNNFLVKSESLESVLVNDLDIHPKQQAQVAPNPRLLYQELESRTDSNNGGGKKNVIQKMVQQLFKKESGSDSDQFIDTMIKDYLKKIESKEPFLRKEESLESNLQPQKFGRGFPKKFLESNKNSNIYLSEEPEKARNGVYQRHSNKNSREYLEEMAIPQFLNKQFQSQDSSAVDGRALYTLTSKVGSENHENILESIDKKIFNHNFYCEKK